jgi:NADPH2:quinone reductase
MDAMDAGLSRRMKALVYAEFGGNDRSASLSESSRTPGPTRSSCGWWRRLNPVDYKIREGYLRGVIDTQLPAVPGWDVAGIVEKSGWTPLEFAVGDAVLAYARADVVSTARSPSSCRCRCAPRRTSPRACRSSRPPPCP